MNFSSIEKIADAILFEGYILYPYRPSSIKNRQRWNFGTLYPRQFCEAQTPRERWHFSAQVLVAGNEKSTLFACVRFLQLVPAAGREAGGWEEGFARCRAIDGIPFAELCRGVDQRFDLSALSSAEVEAAPKAFSEKPREGVLTLRADLIRDGLYRLHIHFANESQIAQPEILSHAGVQDVAFTSAHGMLGVEDGTFVSLLEPPPEHEIEAKACVHDGVFPVLAGESGDRSHMLCSPIILYDYPEVASESAGDFFDGTEMDEMLALRVLTLTDEEKAEMRRSDPHARAILERTETLPEEQLARVHGAVRGLRRIVEQPEPAMQESIDLIEQPFNPFAETPPIESVRVFGMELHTGDRVRLWPQKKADIMDLAMEGKVAMIQAIEQDLENNVQFAVVLEDDPGRDMGMIRQTGHRFFFSPEEVEPLGLEAS